mgnify:CR=1 FL=1
MPKKGKGKKQEQTNTVIKYRKFELLCNPETVQPFRMGTMEFSQVIAVEEIFTNSSKGNVAKAQDLEKAFDTSNFEEIAELILKKGQFSFTTKELADMREQKKRQVVELIHTNFIEPKTEKPYSVSLIEHTLKEIRFVADPHVPATKQFEKCEKKLKDKIVLKPVEN